MAWQNYISISFMIAIIFLQIKPIITIQFSISTFLNGDIVSGEIGTLSYSTLCVTVTGSYTNRSNYQSNLLAAFSNLTVAATATSPFSNTTVGSGRDKVHASFHCHHDISPRDCLTCVQNLTEVLSQNCTTKEAVVYSNKCDVGYTNGLNLTDNDTTSILYCNTVGAKVPDTVSFNRTVMGAMEGLMGQFNSGRMEYYYSKVAASSVFLDQEVYTAAQCAVDVSGSTCKACLARALNETLGCLEMGATWGTDYRMNCRMRYGLEPFGNVTSPSPSPAPSTMSSSPNDFHPSNSPGWRRSASLLCISIVSTVIILVI